MKQTITRRELAEKFRAGTDRKMQELEYFRVMSFEHPEKSSVYDEIVRFLEYEIRYYRVGAAYYSDDIDSLTADPDDDLLYLTQISETSPRIYAQYLREIDRDARADEKITHSCLGELKFAMARTMERM